MPNRYEEALDRIAGKFRKTAEAAARAGIIPYKSEAGRWIASPYDGNSWWTGGFWPGLMWQLWTWTGDEFFLREARRVEKLLTEGRAYKCEKTSKDGKTGTVVMFKMPREGTTWKEGVFSLWKGQQAQ